MKNKLLIVDDDRELCEILKLYLEDFGFDVKTMFHSARLMEVLHKELPDLIVLDIEMPGEDGFACCEKIREFYEDIPIIFLTSHQQVDNRVKSFKLGANDFVGKPFSLEELKLRIETRLKDYQRLKKQTSLYFGNLVLDLLTEKISYQGCEISLTSIEMEIFQLLAKHPEKIYSEKEIFMIIWKEDYTLDTRMVNVHISNIRKKLLKIDPNHKYIQTRWSKGYQYIG